MNTTQLECFVSLAKTLNYMKTAEELSLTQPAVSKQIQSLENELGCTLFHRTTRYVTLTPIGASFLEDATTILETLSKSKRKISHIQQLENHSIRIGYLDTKVLEFISSILKELSQTYPSISPSYFKDQTDTNLNRLLNNQIDLLIGIKDAKFQNENVSFVELKKERFLCVFHKEHPLAQKLVLENRNFVRSKELWEYRQIISIPPYLLKATFSRGRTIIPVNDELDNIICMDSSESYSLLLSNLGFAFLPMHQLNKNVDLLAFEWEESPQNSFGIYTRTSVLKNPESLEQAFISIAEKKS